MTLMSDCCGQSLVENTEEEAFGIWSGRCSKCKEWSCSYDEDELDKEDSCLK